MTTMNQEVLEKSKNGSAGPVLRVEDLHVTYYTDAGRAKALDGVSLSLNAGEKLGLVGESGAGKSTMALAMMSMIKPPGRIEGGKVIVDGTDLVALPVEQMLQARLSKIAYIPQGAMNSLNPVTRIGAQMVDAIVHDKHRVIPCSAYCDKEYGVGGYYVGVPVILGERGVERIIELELNEQEQTDFQNSVDAVKGLVTKMAELVGG